MFLLRLAPLFLQLLGFVGTLIGTWWAGMSLLGMGIGSPTGIPEEAYWDVGLLYILPPLLVLLAGWIWVNVAYLFQGRSDRKRALVE